MRLATFLFSCALLLNPVSHSWAQQLPQIKPSATHLEFAEQQADTSSPPQTVTITNVGAVPVRMLSVSVTTSGNVRESFIVSTNNCTSPSAIVILAPAESCSITITFIPKMVEILDGNDRFAIHGSLTVDGAQSGTIEDHKTGYVVDLGGQMWSDTCRVKGPALEATSSVRSVCVMQVPPEYCSPSFMTPKAQILRLATVTSASPSWLDACAPGDVGLDSSALMDTGTSTTTTGATTTSTTSTTTTTTSTTTTTLADRQAPTVPTGLTATAAGSYQIDLTWTSSTDNVGVTAYTIYRNGIQVETRTVTTWSNTGLSPSTTYAFTVMACDAAGNCSAQSSSTSATTAQSTSTSTTAKSDCLFNWAESTYAALFSPKGTLSLTFGPYYLRVYSATNAYLAVSGSSFVYLGPLSGNQLLDLGPVSTWYANAGCS